MAAAGGTMSVPFSAMKTGKLSNVIFIHCVERLSTLLSVGRCRQSGMLLYFLRGYFINALQKSAKSVNFFDRRLSLCSNNANDVCVEWVCDFNSC